jgi:SSS family solute:Na+ symporter
MVGGIYISKKYMRSVADFLAAGRSAGRYLVSVGQWIAALGAITVIANFEMNYQAGFPMTWWGLSMGVVVLILTVSGWVVYRFRQTRAMTMAQFFEMRYSRNFRVFAGIMAFLAGIINFGIFPAVGANFFIYFCGLPETFSLFGLEISTFAFTMVTLLSIALFFVFIGGQIAVIVTDFIQGVFVNLIFVIVILLFVSIFDYQQIFEALQTAPRDASLINPFKTSAAKDFNIWYHLIGVFGAIYVVLSWQGTQGYNTSARSAHEAKMGAVLSNWRGIPQVMLLLFIPVCAYTVLHHANFILQADSVNAVLEGVDSKTLQSQLTVPLVLTQLLPVGLMGAFAAVMLAAFVSTHDTYLHSWGSIFIQDVILPLRKKSFAPEQHIKVLRISIIAVAIFIFFFSLLFKQSEYILLFFAITGAIYAGGSGSVIIGGLYWKRGTTAAAWAAMIVGSSIAVGGIIIHQIEKDFFINGQVFWFIAMAAAIVIYILVSLLGKKQVFDMDKLLHRGKYVIEDEYKVIEKTPQRGLKILGIGKEFTKGDKILYYATYTWILSWFFVFIIGTTINLTGNVSDESWMKFWYIYLAFNIAVSIIVVFWFTIGGFKDLRAMFRRLKTMRRDHRDDGTVIGHVSAYEIEEKADSKEQS